MNLYAALSAFLILLAGGSPNPPAGPRTAGAHSAGGSAGYPGPGGGPGPQRGISPSGPSCRSWISPSTAIMRKCGTPPTCAMANISSPLTRRSGATPPFFPGSPGPTGRTALCPAWQCIIFPTRALFSTGSGTIPAWPERRSSASGTGPSGPMYTSAPTPSHTHRPAGRIPAAGKGSAFFHSRKRPAESPSAGRLFPFRTCIHNR